MSLESQTLLVCIAFFYTEEHSKYLKILLNNFRTYQNSVYVIVDTNSEKTVTLLKDYKNVEVCVYDLQKPFHLTWMHRKHIIENIDKYDVFMYTEDDMVVPYENYLDYLEKFSYLWPNDVPSFIRIEEKCGVLYNVDNVRINSFLPKQILFIQGRMFVSLKNSYHAFWIMPQKELKSTMTQNFFRLEHSRISREISASYPSLELQKKGLVELVGSFPFNLRISNRCYSYHLPNYYTNSLEWEHYGKIKVADLVEIR